MFNHMPVLLHECIEALNIRPDSVLIDGTAGGGGHSAEILKYLTTGRLVCIDKDPDAFAHLREKFAGNDNVLIAEGCFSEMTSIVHGLGIEKVDGILLDIGVSSHQIDTGSRGFSWSKPAELDMRMSQSGATAADIVNTYEESDLAKIFFQFGEERYSRFVAGKIVKAREKAEITDTTQLADIVLSALPAAARREPNPAKRVFQALRIAVNHELDELSQGVISGIDLLNPGGRFAVITFQSLEDKILKKSFNSFIAPCTCPKDFPICTCGKLPQAKQITKKPITASAEELERNPRSKPAKLRVIEKI
jgi:S-adenosyl-methyltransferase MraW